MKEWVKAMRERYWVARWLWRIVVWLDQGLNVIFLNGDPDETVSSHAGKDARKGERWACVLCKLLDKLDPGHCVRYMEADEGSPIPPLPN